MRAMSSKSDQRTSPKPCSVVIKFPNESQAVILEKNINHGALDPGVYKKFDLKRDENFLSINIHDVHDSEFSNGFLLALGASVKKLVSSDNEASGVSFHFQGEAEADVAICMAAYCMWSATFSFASQQEKLKFDKKKLAIHAKIKLVSAKAIPLLKEKLTDKENNKGK